MSDGVTVLPAPQIRETIKLLRDIAKRLEQGEGVPLMLATAAADGSAMDVRSHNIVPAGAEDTRALMIAGGALFTLQAYVPPKAAREGQ